MTRHTLGTIAIAVLTIVVAIGSLFVGVLDISGLLHGDLDKLQILLVSRLPRLLALLCTGAGMSVSGLIMQKIAMNKFVSPSTGATIASAQFGVMLSLIWFTSAPLLVKTALAFGCALLGTGIFIFFIQRIHFKDVVLVPLIGIMIGAILNGITEYYALQYDVYQAMLSTFVGDFSLVLKGRYEIVLLVVPLIILAYAYANHFNIVGLGQDFAKNLGVNYLVILILGMAIASSITASVIVTVGAISYVGLIIPNMVALYRGDNIRGSLLDVMLAGCLLVVSCDVLARLIVFPYELPIELIIGVVGSALFLYLIYLRLSGVGLGPRTIVASDAPLARTPREREAMSQGATTQGAAQSVAQSAAREEVAHEE